MPAKKQKVPLEATIRVPKALDREIEAESYRLDLFKYEVVSRAWDAYQSRRLGPQRVPLNATPYDAVILDTIHALHKAGRTGDIEALVTILKSIAAKGKK